MAEAAAAAALYYARAETITTPPPPLISIAASSLKRAGRTIIIEDAPPAAAAPDDPLGGILNRAGLEASDFGTIVHSFLEARFKEDAAHQSSPQIPPRIQARLNSRDIPPIYEAAENMARTFLDSELGKLALNAAYHESEFSIITMAETKTGKIPVFGKIDLLFESEGVMYVVDFKTDRVEEPERHLPQLAAYSRAVSDIFGKPVCAKLVYLRSCNVIDVTDEVQDMDIAII
jgi:ATP-dependent helicase/nuclease subunit A